MSKQANIRDFLSFVIAYSRKEAQFCVTSHSADLSPTLSGGNEVDSNALANRRVELNKFG